jgi:hypothetical protein
MRTNEDFSDFARETAKIILENIDKKNEALTSSTPRSWWRYNYLSG